MARLKVLFFASCREAAGLRETDVELDGPTTVAALLDTLCRAHPSLGPLSGSLQVAVNAEYASRDACLSDGDEVALIPPVSGGSGDVFRIVTEAIAVDALQDQVRAPEDGAVVTFSGTVRNRTGERETSYLEYEAYPEMAERVMARLAAQARERWPVGRIGILHRVGRLEIGEISILVSVAAGHRREAFEACHHLVDRLKEEVPIWKKEVGPDGQYWVEGPPAGEAPAP